MPNIDGFIPNEKIDYVKYFYFNKFNNNFFKKIIKITLKHNNNNHK